VTSSILLLQQIRLRVLTDNTECCQMVFAIFKCSITLCLQQATSMITVTINK